MALLKTIVDDDTKAAFAALARQRNTSEAELLRQVVQIVLGDDTPAEQDAEALAVPDDSKAVAWSTYIVPELRGAFRAQARRRGVSVVALLHEAISSFLGRGVVDGAVTPAGDTTASERITVWVPPYLKRAVGDAARKRRMSPSGWVHALIQAWLTRRPTLTERELSSLRVNNRELAAIGRNINQIAHALNIAFSETERVRLDKLAALEAAIGDNQARILELERASLHYWIGSDGTY